MRTMYEYQYALVKQWKQKFEAIMQMAEKVRTAERFQNLYKTGLTEKMSQEEILDYCGTGRIEEDDDVQIGKRDLYKALSVLFTGGKCQAGRNGGCDEDISKEPVRTEKKCLEECLNLVTTISNHSLRKTSIDDFYYIMNYALEELELITVKVEEKQMEQSYCLQLNGSEADFEILEQVRKIENKNRDYALMDYLGI